MVGYNIYAMGAFEFIGSVFGFLCICAVLWVMDSAGSDLGYTEERGPDGVWRRVPPKK